MVEIEPGCGSLRTGKGKGEEGSAPTFLWPPEVDSWVASTYFLRSAPWLRIPDMHDEGGGI
jgi:hypothetical protein